jgi:hypothetical protein
MHEGITRIDLWDDDNRTELSDPLGTDPRNDFHYNGLGIAQDHIFVRTVTMDVTLTIRNEKTQETTHKDHPNPNSRGELGLWHRKRGDRETDCDWREDCVNYLTGDYDNGGATYESSSHPNNVGTGLKAEVYARINKSQITDYDFLLAQVNDKRNWRIRQDKSHEVKINGQPNPNPTWPPPDWYDDAGYRMWDSVDAFLECSPDRDIEYFYNGDCPGPKGLKDSGITPPGYVVDQKMHFVTWVEFCCCGCWVPVTPVPAPEGQWTKGKPMWGFSCQMLKMSSSWTVTDEAHPNSY